MKTCSICNRQVYQTQKLYNGGIKYACVLEEDVILCEKIRDEKQYLTFADEQFRLSTTYNAHKCSHCNRYFLHFVEIETFPAIHVCPLCGH